METEVMTPEEASAMKAMQQDQAPADASDDEEISTSEAPAETAVEAPKAEADKAEEKPAEEKSAEPDEPERQKTVPHQALHEERERRKQAEREMAELRQRIEAFEKAKAAQEAPKAPDPVMDPEGFAKWQTDQLRERDERFEAFQRQQQAAAQRQQFIERTAREEAAFRETAPDYDDAISYLGKARLEELGHFGVDPEEARKIVAQEAEGIVVQALRAGRNVAETAYNIAKARGYRAKAQEQATPDEGARLEALAKAQRETESLSGSVGGESAGGYTLKQLAAMSERELAKVPAEIKRRVMGG